MPRTPTLADNTLWAPLPGSTPIAHPFRSFFQGGFDCATHRRRDHRRVDVIRSTHHDLRAAEDYTLLAEAGIRTVRDGLRWHLVERTPSRYNWSSFLPMLHAALATGTQVIWDLCHWGVPAGLDPFSPDFVPRFAAFAHAAARLIHLESGGLAADPPWFCPINEISFWAWVGGEAGAFHPHARRRAPQLKRQLVRASLAAIRAIRQVDPRARFLQAEPRIHITASRANTRRWPHLIGEAADHTEAQFEAFDLLAGLREPELGGTPDCLDVLGANHYWDSQWVHRGERKPLGHPAHRPLHYQLLELHERYGRPILISETGAEGSADVGWLGYTAAEARQAQREGAKILGLCLYPVMDYPGWDDGRHCACGLIALDEQWERRTLRTDLVGELQLQNSITTA